MCALASTGPITTLGLSATTSNPRPPPRAASQTSFSASLFPHPYASPLATVLKSLTSASVNTWPGGRRMSYTAATELSWMNRRRVEDRFALSNTFRVPSTAGATISFSGSLLPDSRTTAAAWMTASAPSSAAS